MALADDLVGAIVQRLDALIAQERDRLRSVGADQHDRLAGHIKGLMTAREELRAEARKFRMRDADADEGDGEPLMI